MKPRAAKKKYSPSSSAPIVERLLLSAMFAILATSALAKFIHGAPENAIPPSWCLELLAFAEIIAAASVFFNPKSTAIFCILLASGGITFSFLHSGATCGCFGKTDILKPPLHNGIASLLGLSATIYLWKYNKTKGEAQ